MGNALADQRTAQNDAAMRMAVPAPPPCPTSAQGMDSVYFQMGCSQVKAAYNDMNNGNAAACANDFQVATNNVNNIQDPVTAGVLRWYVEQGKTDWQAVTPAQDAANQSAFNDTTAELVAANENVSRDTGVMAAQAAEVGDINAGLQAKKNGQDPALAYNGIPDPGGIGTALNLSGQSPKPGLQGLTPGGLAFLGGSTLLLVVGALAVFFFYAKSARVV